MILHDFQQKAIDDVTQAAANGHRRILLQSPTGSGKTVIAAQIIKHASSNGKKVLFLCHRREILRQTVDKLNKFGVDAGIILADVEADDNIFSPVQVASIQTLYARAIRRNKIKLPEADMIIVDECAHMFSSNTWQEIIELYPTSYILGLTATPINRTGKGMAGLMDVLVVGPSIPDLIKGGFLTPIKHYAPTVPDLRGIKIQQGDYNEKQLEKKMDTPTLIGDILQNWSRVCPNRKTIVFASGIAHSVHLAKGFNEIGVKAAHLDGSTPKPERDKIVAKFDGGKIQVLCNCAVLTEGVDIPSASALIFARPTRSLMLYLQVAGRILRPYEGKLDAIILDHSGAIYEHGRVDQEWQWRLEYGEKASTIKTFMPKIPKESKSITCGNCKFVYCGRLVCPECGWKPEIAGKPVETLDAWLQEIGAIEKPKEILSQAQWWRMFKSYALLKNYKIGWAYHKFHEKFGNWPSSTYRNDSSLEPNLEVLAWIHNRKLEWMFRQGMIRKKSKNNRFSNLPPADIPFANESEEMKRAGNELAEINPTGIELF